MKRFARFSLIHRLYAVSAALIVALTAVAAISWMQLSDAQQIATNAGDVRMQQLERIASTELSVTKVLLDLRQAMLVSSTGDVQAAAQSIDAERQQIRHNDEAFLSNITDEAGRDAFHNVWLKMQADAWPVAEANLRLVQDGRRDEAFQMLTAQTIPTFARIQKWLGEERARQGEQLGGQVSDIEQALQSTRLLLVSLVAGIAMGLIAFSWYIGNRLRSRVAEAQKVAERVRDGNFAVTVVDSHADEISPLLGALGAMQNSLSDVVRSVRRNAESVALASAEIAAGNADLSARTEEQAASLEETASSMEELASTVRHNADNARQATALANTASDIAQRGGEVVGRVVETMHGISDSSARVAEIISVIEGIAFQTNILALNAAVEAARAGEQGRGFAVVAGEVRTLAQRSASAAKEIKDLIVDSASRVDTGSKLVEEAGSTITEVVQSVKRVTDIMGEMAAASVEQSNGIEQVSQAVSQMDQVTQQNAALVEEASAATQSMAQQAQGLRDAVSVFKVVDRDASSSRLDAPQMVARRSAPAARRPSRSTSDAGTPAMAADRHTSIATDTGSAAWQAF
ncbi:methyl-accepting chemotaxis protein [Paraburkholderia heleia]|uniref:methyl-accepting chemotaxis protein n=1 Tax=Paraburkholderia heleia TaxID=634127 RepID=UPI002AB77AB8|nr:methyl-accepting chemotaxis protein [Paraburkholderia heleia]